MVILMPARRDPSAAAPPPQNSCRILGVCPPINLLSRYTYCVYQSSTCSASFLWPWTLPVVLTVASFLVAWLLCNTSSLALWEDEYYDGVHWGYFGGPVFDVLLLLFLCRIAGSLVGKAGLPPLAGLLTTSYCLPYLPLNTHENS